MLIKIDGKERKLPDFLVVGAARSGTTSMYMYLSQHPGIFMPSVKEPSFFCYAEGLPFDGSFSRAMTLEQYCSLFAPAASGQCIGEVSPMYMVYCNETIKAVKDFYGKGEVEPAIVMILRDPVSRAFSHFTTKHSRGLEPKPFEEAVRDEVVRQRIASGWPASYDYVGLGRYYEKVRLYKENFSRVRVYLYEDLTKRPQWLMKDLFGFIGVDDSFVPSDLGKRFNSAGLPKTPLHAAAYKLLTRYNPAAFLARRLLHERTKTKLLKMLRGRLFSSNGAGLDAETEARLRADFREDILKLQDLIRRDLSGWL
ncbi:MAG TPA: hypothetical protein ENJ37_09690 [Deltaproteobacteria bacterium]|nr:hypothetical protein [Deltaproteobacteria bacterium]